MDIKIGKLVGYRTRTHTGNGKVTDVAKKSNGTWVTVHDDNRDVVVKVQQGQIFANAKAAAAAGR